MDREKERQIVIQGRAQGKSDDFIKQAVVRYRERSAAQPAVATVAPEAPAKPSFLAGTAPSYPAAQGGAGTILPNIARTAGNIPSSARNLVRGSVAPVNPLDIESPLNIGSNFVKIADTANEILKRRGLFGGLKDVAAGAADVAKKGFDAYKNVGEKIYNNLEQNVLGENSVTKGVGVSAAQGVSTIAEKGIEDPLLVPSLLYGGGKLGPGGKTVDAISDAAAPVTRGADTSIVGISKNLTAKSEEQIESAIVKKFEKGVKPNLPGKTTPTQLQNYRDDVVEAVKTINENKINLKFADDVGDVIQGQNPKTLQQLSEAVEQTKKSVFTKYDSLAKQAGEAGLKIDTEPIALELDNIINNEALQFTHPQTVKYAQDLKARFASSKLPDGSPMGYKSFDPSTLQDIIQNYNRDLEAFYRNPSYESASRAAVDAMVVNRFRKSLDEGVTGLTGEKYQALKNQYASLKTIERDVIKATLRDARKNVKGLIDYSDIFSGGQVVNGILSLNPGLIASGVAQKGIASYFKFLNNPNRAVDKMFQTYEKGLQQGVRAAPKPLPKPAPAPIKKQLPNRQGGFINPKAMADDIKKVFTKTKVLSPEDMIARDIGTLLDKAQSSLKEMDAVEYLEEMQDKVAKRIKLSDAEKRLYNMTAVSMGFPKLKVPVINKKK